MAATWEAARRPALRATRLPTDRSAEGGPAPAGGTAEATPYDRRVPVGRAIASLGRALESAYASARRPVEAALLERRYGFPRQAPEATEPSDEERYRRDPSPWGILGLALRPDDVTPGDVFLDVGCGTGRILVEAGRYPFERLIGVEVLPELAAVARSVVARNRHRLRSPHVEVVTVDVLDYEIPDDVTVVYFGDPFGRDVLESVLRRLGASVARAPRRVLVVYAAPPADLLLDEWPGARFVRYGRRRLRRWAPATDIKVYELGQGTSWASGWTADDSVPRSGS